MQTFIKVTEIKVNTSLVQSSFEFVFFYLCSVLYCRILLLLSLYYVLIYSAAKLPVC